MARFINKKTGVIANVPDGFAMGTEWVTPDEFSAETPEEVAECKKSYTGMYLKQALK